MLQALEAPPTVADPLFWADFIELRALVHPDKSFSRGDLGSLFVRLRDTTGECPTNHEMRWRDLIDFAGVRVKAFGNSYPFRISDDADTLELSFDESVAQRNYLQLLLASLMRHIPQKKRGELARFFEQASHAVFAKLMPPGAEIRATWAHGGEQSTYTGTLFQKMQKIAQDIRCTENFKDRDFKPTDTGDGGIDMIAWHPMSDEREGLPIAFAQCGCSKDEWRFKQLEASPAKHGRHLPAMHPWATYYFLPLDLRHADGDWAYKSDIGAAIIVDRLRLLRLASQYHLHDLMPALPLLPEIQQFSYA